MKNILKISFVCLFASSAIAAEESTIAAVESGFYVGGGGGYGKFTTAPGIDRFVREIDEAVRASSGYPDVSIGLDKDEPVWKIFGGYRANQYLAFEIGYLGLGHFAYTTDYRGFEDVERYGYDVSSITMAAIVKYPLSPKLDVYGKGGVNVWYVDVGYTEIRFSDTVVISESEVDDGTDPMFGVGAEYKFDQKWGVRAEWERLYIDRLDIEHVDVFSLGIKYNFL